MFVPGLSVGESTDWIDTPVEAQALLDEAYNRIRRKLFYNQGIEIPSIWIRMRYLWNETAAWNTCPTRLYYGDPENGSACMAGYLPKASSALFFIYSRNTHKWKLGRIF